jgi:hypothetical protein
MTIAIRVVAVMLLTVVLVALAGRMIDRSGSNPDGKD